MTFAAVDSVTITVDTRKGMHGQVVLIVGASSGIGRLTATLFAREGANVIAAARRHDRLQTLRQELAAEGIDITIRQADACSVKDMQQLAQETLARFERIDIVVYATGTNTPERTMEELDPAVWDAILNTNLSGAFYISKAVLPSMRAAHSGHLIYVASMAGVTADLSGAAYQASKRGMLGLAHAIRLEEQRNGIRTCVLCPGLINTELVEKRKEKLSPEALIKALHPQDVAEMILYVAKLPKRVAMPEIQMVPAEA
jgi:serine 3-dehydrogenase (NADP+)